MPLLIGAVAVGPDEVEMSGDMALKKINLIDALKNKGTIDALFRLCLATSEEVAVFAYNFALMLFVDFMKHVTLVAIKGLPVSRPTHFPSCRHEFFFLGVPMKHAKMCKKELSIN